jgi:hypothetical protein
MPMVSPSWALGTREERARLEIRREPYWVPLSLGIGLGYQRSRSGGIWLVRFMQSDHHYRKASIGSADDARTSNGLDVLSHQEALVMADQWATKVARQQAGIGRRRFMDLQQQEPERCLVPG